MIMEHLFVCRTCSKENHQIELDGEVEREILRAIKKNT